MAWLNLLSRILPVLLLAAALPVMAVQCPTCAQLSHTKDIGACKLCGDGTNSGQFQLCMNCSDRLQECERCLKPLSASAPPIEEKSDKTYTFGRWSYQFTVSNQGSRSEGYLGTLSFAGKSLPEPAKVNDHVRTPWGPIYWVGRPVTAFGGHGWMPHPKPSQPVGDLVAPPGPATKCLVMVKVMTDHRGQPVTEDWILKELKAFGATEEVGVVRDWAPLGSETIPIHDSKHFGQASLRLRDSGETQPLIVEISGSQPSSVELARQVGAKRVVKHTIASSIASMDLYLAFRVDRLQP